MDFEKIGGTAENDKEIIKPKVEANIETPDNVENIKAMAERKLYNIKNKSEELKVIESKIEGINRIELEEDIFKSLREKLGIDAELEDIYGKGKMLVGKFKEKISEILGKNKVDKLIDEAKKDKEAEAEIDKPKNQEQSEEEKTRACSKCGSEWPINYSYCNECGEDLRFDPNKEIKNIRKGTKEKQRKKLSEFKEKMINQKKAIAEVQKKILKEIERNPDATVEEYQKSAGSFLVKLSLDQQFATIWGIEAYCRTHQAIKENTEDCIDKKTGKVDGPKLYEKLFNRKPEGRIGIILRPAIIHLRTENLDDYVFAYNHGAIDQIDDEARKKTDGSGGCKLTNFHIAGLENAITLEKATNGRFDKMSPFAKSVLEHEEQHVINSLIMEAYDLEEIKRKKKQEKIDKINSQVGEIGQQIFSESHDYSGDDQIEEIEKSVKDEISAYFKDGKSPEEVREKLLKPETLYKYGFDYKGGNREKSEFSQKYIDLVENGILAYNYLLKGGYSKEDAQALLFTEPLSKWSKVVERLGVIKREPNIGRFDEKQAGENLRKTKKKREFYRLLEKEVANVKNRLDFHKLFQQIGEDRKSRAWIWEFSPMAVWYTVKEYLESDGNKKLLNKIPSNCGFREKAADIFMKEHGKLK
ncbi:MAG: hypothetical protein V1804_03245 [Patescibacteria group bacterium]